MMNAMERIDRPVRGGMPRPDFSNSRKAPAPALRYFEPPAPRVAPVVVSRKKGRAEDEEEYVALLPRPMPPAPGPPGPPATAGLVAVVPSPPQPQRKSARQSKRAREAQKSGSAVVERIVRHEENVDHGYMRFLVRYAGEAEEAWIDEDDLQERAPDVLATYWLSHE
jgi:hypothetical protein